ncbi:MAG: hypothetical protein RL250_1873 [Verrucomicrobiota bacterium]|jgi:membrane protease YdiL (CAAX protease family)
MDKSTEALLAFALGLCVLAAWYGEFRLRRRTGAPEGFWPGTTLAPAAAYFVAATGAILITVAEAGVEMRFDVTESQSQLPLVALFGLVGAAVTEEAVFRGFAAPSHFTGRKLLLLVLGGSAVFAAIHIDFLDFNPRDEKQVITLVFEFLTGVWLYLARYNPLNPTRSLLPCFMGHIVRNLAVFGIKWAQGFVN